METIRDYAPEIRDTLQTLVNAGFTLRAVDNGGDEVEKTPDIESAVHHIDAVDEALLYVTAPSGKRLWVSFVMGNSPGELVADHADNAEINGVLSAVSDKWWGKPQPMREGR